MENLLGCDYGGLACQLSCPGPEARHCSSQQTTSPRASPPQLSSAAYLPTPDPWSPGFPPPLAGPAVSCLARSSVVCQPSRLCRCSRSRSRRAPRPPLLPAPAAPCAASPRPARHPSRPWPEVRPRPHEPRAHVCRAGRSEAGRRVAPTQLRAPIPSRPKDQPPRGRPPRPGVASSPRRSRPQGAPFQVVPMLAFFVCRSPGLNGDEWAHLAVSTTTRPLQPA